MQNIPHYRLMRNLCVVAMSHINGIILSLAHIRGKRLPMIVVRRFIIRSAVLGNEIRDERIRARGIIRRTGQGNDVLVLRNGEAFDMAYLVDIRFCELHGETPRTS